MYLFYRFVFLLYLHLRLISAQTKLPKYDCVDVFSINIPWSPGTSGITPADDSNGWIINVPCA